MTSADMITGIASYPSLLRQRFRLKKGQSMAFNEYEKYDAMGLAELVRQKQVSPQELLDAAIERIEARDPSINAVVTSRSQR